MIDTQPTICNLCGGEVILCNNARVYHFAPAFCSFRFCCSGLSLHNQ